MATGRSLTHKVSALSYHISGAVPSPVSWPGQVITQRPPERSETTSHHRPGAHTALGLMMRLRCYTFSEWFGSTPPEEHCKRKYRAGKTGKAGVL